MVDIRPLLFLNALIIMLFLTAGFAHIKHPSATETHVASSTPTQDTKAEIEQAITPEILPGESSPQDLDELPVFADETPSAVSEAPVQQTVSEPEQASNPEVLVASLDARVPDTEQTRIPAAETPPPVEMPPVVEPPPLGTLIVRSNVGGDKVRINGKDYGPSAVNLELSPGEYVVEVTKQGFKGWTKSVQVARGSQRVVNAVLEQITSVEYRNGAWRFNVVTGDGNYFGKDGTRYEGGFLNKQFHGRGKLTLPDGTSYEGEWSNGKKDGQGTLKLSNGDSYSGQFRGDEFNGDGTLTKSNGDIYAGQWSNGKLNGEGSLTTKQGLMYVGGFIDNEFSGNGDITYPDGTHYEGGFTKSIFHGKGVLTYRDGKKYTGQFIDGQFHGKGELQNPNGSKITGTFKFGKPYGQASLTTPEGEVFTARSSEPGVCYRLKSYRATQCPPMEGW